METMMGYLLQTTFWEDFTVADRFGVKVVKDTFKRAFNGWKDNYVYLTELAIVMNWKLWEHYENKNNELAMLYREFLVTSV
jgi:hypothetical protein